MKRIVITGILLMCTFSLFAQIRNGQNLKLYSWTKSGAETGMVDQIVSAVVQTNGNEIKYTMRTKDDRTLVIEFNRVTKRLHFFSGPEAPYSTIGSFRESGSTSIFTFSDKSGAGNILKFKRI
jgi:hypothetical protein